MMDPDLGLSFFKSQIFVRGGTPVQIFFVRSFILTSRFQSRTSNLRFSSKGMLDFLCMSNLKFFAIVVKKELICVLIEASKHRRTDGKELIDFTNVIDTE